MANALGAREFEARFRELVSRLGEDRENLGSVHCTACRSCKDCTFCRHSSLLLRCHYCVDCERCSDSSHCHQSQNLVRCQHCSWCEQCSSSAYLVRCVSLVGCNYCFGCVGLNGRDFHILNERYERAEYFAVTRRLEKELGL